MYKCPAAKLQLLTVWSLILVHLQTFSGLWYEPQMKINKGKPFFVEYLNFERTINTQNWGSSLKRTLFFSKLSNDECLTAEFFTITWVSSTGKVQYMTVVFKYSLPSKNEQEKSIIWHLERQMWK